MTIFRAPLANSKGEVMLSMQATGVVPAGAVPFRGLWVTINGLVCATNDTGQARKYVGGFALEDPSGLLLVTETAPVSVPMDGINANAAGAVVTKTGAASLIHQGVAMTVSAPGGPLVVNKDEPALTFLAPLERGVNSAAIEGVGTRDSEATYWAEDGRLKVAAVNEIRQEFQNGQPLGTLMEPASTNKCTNYNANPDSGFTNITPNLGPGVTLERVNDLAELQAAGLNAVCSDGNALKVDNSAGTETGYVAFEGDTGNTNTHSISIWGRATAGQLQVFLRADETDLVSTNSPVYVQLTAKSITPDATNRRLTVKIDIGSICYFILNQLEEQSVPTSVIVTEGAAASRAVDGLQWPLVSEPVGEEKSSNPGFDNGASGWTLGCGAQAGDGYIRTENYTGATCALGIDSGALVLQNTWYRVTLQISTAINARLRVFVIGTQSEQFTEAGIYVFDIKSGDSGNQLQINLESPDATTVRVDFLGIKPLTPILNQSEGMGALIFRPSAEHTVQGSNNSRHLALGEPAASYPWISHGFNASVGQITDGTSTQTTSKTYSADDTILLAWRWGSATMEINAKLGGAWNAWSAGAYDGSFSFLDFLRLAINLQFPAHYRGIYLWSEDKGTAWLESFFSGVAN